MSSGWAASSPVKESLGAFGYMAVTHQSAAARFATTSMARYAILVGRLHRCLRDANDGIAEPRDVAFVTAEIDAFAASAEGFAHDQPQDFSAVLHHVILFGEMWTGPPELTTWGAGLAPHAGPCRLTDWQAYFSKEVVWAPDFVTLTRRFQEVFDSVGYRELESVVRSDVAESLSVSVFITGADLDGMTPFIVGAQEVYDSQSVCKAMVELRTGGHCVSGTACVHPASVAFFQTDAICSNGSFEPRPGTDFEKALKKFPACNAQQEVSWDATVDGRL